MWNLITTWDTPEEYIDLFEAVDTADVGTNYQLRQFHTKEEALQKVAELGLSYEEQWN